jgi:elongator complex protein 2
MIATGSEDNYIRIWKVSLTSSDKTRNDMLDALADLDLDNANKQLSTKAHVVTIGEHECFTFLLDAVLIGHDDWVFSAEWSRPETQIVNGEERVHQPMVLLSASADKSLIIWEPDTHSQSWIPKDRVGEVGGTTLGFYGAKMAANGKRIFANGYNGAIHVWEKSAGTRVAWEPIVGISGHFMPVQELKWDPTGSYFISTSLDQTSRVFSSWKRETGVTWHEIGRSQIHGYNLNTLAFTNKYQYVSGADEKVIRVFDAPKLFALSLENLGGKKETEEILSQRPLGANLPALGLSNKAVFGDGGQQETYQSAYGTPLTANAAVPLTQPPFEEHLLQNTLWPETAKLYGHVYEIICVATNKSGTLVASASKAAKPEHATIRLWNTTKWVEACKPLEGHSLSVTAISFSQNGKWLLSAGRDRSWILFDVSNVLETGSWSAVHAGPKAHGRIIWTTGFTHDDKFFITGSRDKAV